MLGMAKSDDKKFNETLKRMLETPPKPHEPESEKKPPQKKKKTKRKTVKKPG
jgi:hypothetical protein